MFETVAHMDLSEMDLYARHQQVAALFSRDRNSPRDYQFAVEPDMLYLRSPYPRIEVDGWRPMRPPRSGAAYAVSGVVCVDAAHLGPNRRATWRQPPVMRAILTDWMRGAGVLSDVRVSFEPSLPMTKGDDRGSQKTILRNPIRFSGVLRVDSDRQAERAWDIQRSGIGRGRGFGFGCVHLREIVTGNH